MSSYISPTAALVSSTGISAPSFAAILAYLVESITAISPPGINLASDTQDGQMLAIFAQAVSDSNSTAVNVYNQFSPATAVGAGLSSVVKINGIAREVATFSTVDLTVVGVAGTILTDCIASDAAGAYKWDLPSPTTIPPGGSLVVTATCETQGAITAAPGTITSIVTPTRGWQSVTNASSASPGAPVESDAALARRQTVSTAIPSLSILDGIIGAVANLSGVTAFRGYENDTGTTDGNGIPGHSISLVVQGGDAVAIATAIVTKKGPGCGTHGTTTETVNDIYGIPHAISFYVPTVTAVTVAITLSPLSGYNSNNGVEIQNAVSAYINSIGIGQNVLLTRIYLPANLSGSPDSLTYEITALTLNGSSADVTIAFNAIASCPPSSVVVTV